jgi:hypothetical protein
VRVINSMFALCVAVVICSGAQAQRSGMVSHAQAIRTMNACQAKMFPACEEVSVYRVIQRYMRGDRSLLTPLLKAFSFSDGALREELGEFYGTELKRHPSRFLAALSRRPRSSQDLICLHANVNVTNKERPLLLRRLRHLGKRNWGMAYAAQRCMDSIPDGKTYPNTDHK